MRTRHCSSCSGTMWHSSDMDDPFPGEKPGVPFWQCEDCGATLDVDSANSGGAKLYTTTEAAAYVGLKKTGFLKHADNIPHQKIGGRRLYTQEALDAFKAVPRPAGRPKGSK